MLFRSVEIGDYLMQELKSIPNIVELRGRGLMIGIELDRPCGDLVKQALAQGLLINVTSDKVIRLVPPLIINAQEAQQLIAGVTPLVKAFLVQAA